LADDVMKRAADTPATPPQTTTGIVPAQRESRAERARKQVYRSRFMIIYVLLAAVCGLGIGAFIVLVQGGGPAPEVAWSSFEPTGSAERRSAQIGDHVSDKYLLPSGNQLTTVTYSGSPSVTAPEGGQFEVRAIAVRPDTRGGRAEADDIDTVNAENTIMYNLCGLGESCSLADGAPTVEHGQLLRRQALELGLYSFKYVDGTDSVLVLLPPRADGQDATALFFERSDVGPALSRPLDETLSQSLTPGLGQIAPDEVRFVDSVTRARLYLYQYLQAQDGSPVMLLTPALGA
jgi:hypothetical protein